jgi:hypothetical protein
LPEIDAFEVGVAEVAVDEFGGTAAAFGEVRPCEVNPLYPVVLTVHLGPKGTLDLCTDEATVANEARGQTQTADFRLVEYTVIDNRAPELE